MRHHLRAPCSDASCASSRPRRSVSATSTTCLLHCLRAPSSLRHAMPPQYACISIICTTATRPEPDRTRGRLACPRSEPVRETSNKGSSGQYTRGVLSGLTPQPRQVDRAQHCCCFLGLPALGLLFRRDWPRPPHSACRRCSTLHFSQRTQNLPLRISFIWSIVRAPSSLDRPPKMWLDILR